MKRSNLTPPTPLLRRRAFLRSATAGAASATLPFSLLFSRSAAATSPLGTLRPDPNGILDLPEGFSYRILERAMAAMDDGYHVPGRPDGMGCFPGPDGTLVLMRNHENHPFQRGLGPYKTGQAPPPEAFDAASMGGVSRLVLRADTFERISSNLVLAGTNRNCSGGMSPWGWLSCEEDVSRGHGYVFLCRTDAASVQPSQRIKPYGRFNHEAAVIDPETRIAYLTEDRDDGCFYRFLPDRPDTPFQGKLQALRAVGRDRLDTSSAMKIGVPIEVTWIDLTEPESPGDTLRSEAARAGAAIIRRGEGITRYPKRGRSAVESGAEIYVCSTSGGPIASGQIFRYAPGRDVRPDTLELVAQSTDREVLDRPDNIMFSPWGDLYMAEDGPDGNSLVVLTAQGQTYPLARNTASKGEFAGVCFSPDGRALFTNLQDDGLTLVITGPFHRDDAANGTSDAPSFLPTAQVLSEVATDTATAPAERRGCGRCTTGPDAESPGGAEALALAGVAALGLVARRARPEG